MKIIKGSTVLITGASSGIGKEFAKKLAQKGANLIVTARSKTDLLVLAKELETQYSDIWVKVISVDLSHAEGAEILYSSITEMNLSVDILINNAGFGKWSEFTDESLEMYQKMLSLNMNALVALSYYCLPHMIKQNRGGIINVASTASFQPLPYQAVYGASKAFVLNFSEALSGELLDTQVHVMALCPGHTQTNFMKTANAETSGIPSLSVSDVVDTAISAYIKNRIYVIPGKDNFFKSLIPRLVSRKTTVKIVANMFKNRIVPKSK